MADTQKRPWLHGVENVTKDGRGNVYWRDLRIEHYSPMSPEKELQSATDLAKSCLRLEDLGQDVTILNLFALWDRARWAIDIQDAPKWAVFFDASKDERWIKTLYLGTGEGSSLGELQRVVSATAREFEDQGRSGVRTSIVATKEGLGQAIESIESQFKWARQVYFNHSPGIRDEETRVIDQLRKWIEITDLPTEVDATSATMGISPDKSCVFEKNVI